MVSLPEKQNSQYYLPRSDMKLKCKTLGPVLSSQEWLDTIHSGSTDPIFKHDPRGQEEQNELYCVILIKNKFFLGS